jgi:Fe-S-cluster-containing hydrogenase component 2
MPRVNVQPTHIRRAAPAKPAWGEKCNGCGVCCLAEPCPLGLLASRRRRGACAAVEWDGQRYRCGLLRRTPRWARSAVARWIGAGRGCDSSAEVASY